MKADLLSKKHIGFYGLILSLLLPFVLFAEGSKELSQNGGFRAYLYSSTDISLPSFPFPTVGTMKVYARVGETIYVGSSAQGIGRGVINLRSPDGLNYSSGSSTTIGRINTRAEEVAGPLPNANGYTPFTQTVAAGQEGVWEIDFVAPSDIDNTGTTPISTAANSQWIQTSGIYVAAFDVSVRNTANTAFLSGRVFTNIFSGILGGFSIGFNGIFYILTKDGYQYTIDNNGQAGNGFSFFSNNKGFRTAEGKASYKSVDSPIATNVHDPNSADTESDATHKIFFNPPAADLPLTAAIRGNNVTWLLNPPFVPSASDINFRGSEGTDGKTGTVIGGTINFTTTSNGSYIITIDANRNGVFTDAVDRVLTGIVSTGVNAVKWDGLDGLGANVVANGMPYTANITLSLFSAEVHFPFFDVERNYNGIKLSRTTGAGAPDNTIYWDDSNITIAPPPAQITPPSPIKNTTGMDSYVNGHKWGSPTFTTANSDFGNEKAIDTWAYVEKTVINTAVTFVIQEADLEVTGLVSDISAGCTNQTITYTTTVKNNGPNDVTGATYFFQFPAELNITSVSSEQTTGVTAISNENTTTSQYTATLNIANGALRTFTIKGLVSKVPASGKIEVISAILRPLDIADPDATNPDNAVPSDVFDECNAQPSGTGCNNIKSSSVNFAASPVAGADQVIEENATTTLTANTTGTWLQIGNTPIAVTINTPNSASTTVSGFTKEGEYKFMFTNVNGCSDTLTVSVNANSLDGSANVITPNGDGINDTFTIANIANYPGSKFSVFNRWGNEVYRSDNYKNDWSGQGLSEGTYYYLFRRVDKAGAVKTFKGWIYLKR